MSNRLRANSFQTGVECRRGLSSEAGAVYEADDFDLVARSCSRGEGLAANQAIGLRKRQHHAAVLPGKGARTQPPMRILFDARSHIIFAAVVLRHAGGKNRPLKTRLDLVEAKHSRHCRTQEQEGPTPDCPARSGLASPRTART